jgi:hypothetical protein
MGAPPTVMTMREDCKHFQSRTYDNGDVARMCELDLAPEAPWRCPDECPSYEARLADVNWTHGSLITPPPSEEPEGLDESSLELLEEAEDIVNAVAPEIIDETNKARDKQEKQQEKQEKRQGGGWFRRRR